MEFVKNNWKWLLAGAVGLGICAYAASESKAADLGGTCCSDLEERIAELEATTARKGNKKVSVTLYGELSESLVFADFGGENNAWISSNSSAENFIGVRGTAVISPALKAGFVAELGVGGYEYGITYPAANTNEIYVRQANIYIERDWGGNVVTRSTIGRLSQATDGISEISLANTTVVARMGSLRPLNGPEVGEVLDLYDGTRVDGVRGDATMGGFIASASWTSGSSFPTGDDADIWDVALRYKGEGGGFAFAAGIGYRDGTVIPTFGTAPQLTVVSGSASIKHLTSGIFVNAMVGNASLDGASDDVLTWHVQGGLERKFLTSLGNTTLFAEYAEVDEDKFLTILGAGVVQSFDAAALDIFANIRRIEIDFGGGGDDAYVGQVGARIKF